MPSKFGKLVSKPLKSPPATNFHRTPFPTLTCLPPTQNHPTEQHSTIPPIPRFSTIEPNNGRRATTRINTYSLPKPPTSEGLHEPASRYLSPYDPIHRHTHTQTHLPNRNLAPPQEIYSKAPQKHIYGSLIPAAIIVWSV
ncbi:uncharacterized protein EAF01_005469 [Botrytis porri]|uniref:uncharacterized protein n=1 Tax=Botrytis porri TaxID=87229 RepID=UPI001902173A|nr:uncharacterized protein EAF01_005469 [Botrytis porri]KAF7904947.1 hypothetical protein EAF01_005469 [Botrytis porri]